MTQFSLSLSLVSFSCRRRVAVGLFCHRRIRTRRRAGWRPPGARPGPRHGERVFLAGVLKRSFSPETSSQLLVGPSPGASALCHFPSSLLFSPSTSPSPGCSGADGRRTSCTVEVLLINWVFSDDFFHRSVLTGSHVTVPHQSPHVANVLCLICKTVPSLAMGKRHPRAEQSEVSNQTEETKVLMSSTAVWSPSIILSSSLSLSFS